MRSMRRTLREDVMAAMIDFIQKHLFLTYSFRPHFFRGSSTNQHSSPLQHLEEDGGRQTSVRPKRAGNDWEWNKASTAMHRKKNLGIILLKTNVYLKKKKFLFTLWPNNLLPDQIRKFCLLGSRFKFPIF